MAALVSFAPSPLVTASACAQSICVLALMAGTAMAQSIQGTATYRERMAMIPVITRGSPTSVSIMLERVGGQIPPASAAGNRSLEGTYWKATELAGKATPAQDAKREAHLVFQAGGRLSGSDGCNRITGAYERKGTAVTFGQLAGTQMACIDSAAEIERAFRGALKSTMRLAIAGDRLDLFDAAGNRVASFTASAQASAPTNTPAFAGRSWQLVKFQGSDGTTLTPDDRAKYTIEFVADGQSMARVDCNRGRGTWKSSGPNRLQFGPLALTRAKCPVGSLHDQIVKQWNYIRSYVMKDGHLFLSLMADGGIYEFEPLTESKPSPQAQGGAGRPRVLEVSSLAPEKNAQLSSLIAEIRSEADAFVILSGGASRMREDHQRQLLAMLEALSLVAKGGHRIAVGDGGTQAGIMEAAGHARRNSGNAGQLGVRDRDDVLAVREAG